MATQHDFDWQRQAAAERLCLELLEGFRQAEPALAKLAAQVREEASGRLFDYVDHLLLADGDALREALTGAGFVPQPEAQDRVFRHPGAVLPRLRLIGPGEPEPPGVALRVESIDAFLQAHARDAEIEGEAPAPYRRARLAGTAGCALWVVERRGSDGFAPVPVDVGWRRAWEAGEALWRGRPCGGEDEAGELAEALRRARELTARLGTDPAAHLVCAEERRRWLARNGAGRRQQQRQERLGLGWSNHDHHTFRSSRAHFARLVELFSALGFHRRERFYAGDEAGWGAQLMENPTAGLTLFLDVDLAPGEVATDFAREALPEREALGTVGLWCALHGDSILGAGMHHLAAQFDFERLGADLAGEGIAFLPPFSSFPYLRQAFSVAERWPVSPQRLARLQREKRLSAEQQERFATQGAIGSHLENIERREGYKGFNKNNVSLIIRRTDPRA